MTQDLESEGNGTENTDGCKRPSHGHASILGKAIGYQKSKSSAECRSGARDQSKFG